MLLLWRTLSIYDIFLYCKYTHPPPHTERKQGRHHVAINQDT